MEKESYDFGLIGLGVMGRNFLLNVADHNFAVAGLDTDLEKVEALSKEKEHRSIFGTTDASEFVASLRSPKKIMMLVPAGKAVDAVIEQFTPMLKAGDLLIDGGNSFFTDTDRREKALAEKGILYIGTGVSGGSEGARFGPSIMPGGKKEAYELIKPVFEAVSAKVNDEPCVAYMGQKSAGNYVKMVHNGIEYGIMQIIAEVYDVLKRTGGLSNETLATTFDQWNKDRLQSFLVEITADIFKRKDDITGHELVDMVLDKAKQKGTGKWTSQNAMDLGIAVPTIDAAVSMRGISGQKELRQTLDSGHPITGSDNNISLEQLISIAEKALYFSIIVAYAQGFAQLKEASEEYDYELNMGEIAKIWRGGCIIRAGFLENIRQAYAQNESLAHLFADADIRGVLEASAAGTRTFLIQAIQNGIPTMALSSALSYYDAITSGNLPLNLVQAQRDYFGAHTYERIDKEGIFHSEWK